MKLTIASAILMFFLSFGALGQNTIYDYHYVEVPDQFEFLKGKDQYQVNSLTVFLLKKYGFNAYLTSNMPLYLQKIPCKGLKAEVQSSESFLTTKSYVVFKDCFGNVVFTSESGRSKEKDYRKAYHASVRGAFESIAALNVNQLALSPESAAEAQEADINTATETVESQTASANTAVNAAVDAINEAVDSPDNEAKVVLPEAWFKPEFIFQDYSLVKQARGYLVNYKGEAIGTAMQSEDDLGTFDVITTQFSGTGTLSADGFTVYRQIEGMDQVITMSFLAKQ